MAKRSTLGNNPLDALIPMTAPAPTVKETVPVVSVEEERPARSTSAAKERLTVHLPVSLIDRVKNAVYWTPGLTLAGLAEEALRNKLDELEAINGKPYPQRREELKGGRPLK